MKFDKKKLSQEKQKEFAEKLEKSADKPAAIVEVVEELAAIQHQELIDQITEEAHRVQADSSYKEKVGLRTLSKEENEFYEFLKTDPKQALTAKQPDIIPITIVDNTLENVKKKSRISELIDFSPATVKKWLIAEKSGKYQWGALDGKLTEELSATITALNYELGKLYAMLIIPKAIRELSNEFVDKYLMAILEETLNDGAEYGYICGTGVNMPIGITRLVETKNSDGTAKEKTVLNTVKGFRPADLKDIKKTLSNGGKRSVSSLYLICNPSDNYEFVEPSLYGENITGGYEQKSATKIEVIETENCPLGKGIFTMPHLYKMGFSGIRIDEYKETLAKDDADLLIGKAEGNGRAVDDNSAVLFDITKLEEYVPKFINITPAADPTPAK